MKKNESNRAERFIRDNTEIQNTMLKASRSRTVNKPESSDDFSNDNTEMVDPQVHEIVTNVISQKKGNRKQKFHLYRMFGLPAETCAILCGYSKSYAHNLTKEYKDKPNIRQSVEKILDAMPEGYRSVCKLRLIKIAELDERILQKFESDPELAIRHPALLKQLKQSAGVIVEEDIPIKNPTVNIGSIQVLIDAGLNRESVRDTATITIDNQD